MSDHGFTSWRRSFNLNSWLRDHGYLVVTERAAPATSPGLGQRRLDAHPRLRPRPERSLHQHPGPRGQRHRRPPATARRWPAEIARRLEAAIDPATGQPAVTRAFRREKAYAGARHRGHRAGPRRRLRQAARGCRANRRWACVAAEVFSDNTDAWSGDHSMDPDAVPGVLLHQPAAARCPRRACSSWPAAILAEFGVTDFPAGRQTVMFGSRIKLDKALLAKRQALRGPGRLLVGRGVHHPRARKGDRAARGRRVRTGAQEEAEGARLHLVSVAWPLLNALLVRALRRG